MMRKPLPRIHPDNIISLEDHHRRDRMYRQRLTLLSAGEFFLASNLTDALEGDGILHSDLLHCERVNKVKPGSLAIVNTPFGLMLRYYFLEENENGSFVRLQTANPAFPVLCLAPQIVHIVGRPYRLERDVERKREAAA